jgi:hypothetical protein
MAAFDRRLVVISLLALGLALAGCDSDDDDERAERTGTSPETTPAETTETEETAPEPRPETEPTEPTEPETETETEPAPPRPSPEDEPGGSGDEEPARTLALFTGEGGRITPRVVRVPAYISVRVELRSADGRDYGLSFANETTQVQVSVSGQLGSVSSTIDGLRPGESITGTSTPDGARVRIEATAEPGP